MNPNTIKTDKHNPKSKRKGYKQKDYVTSTGVNVSIDYDKKDLTDVSSANDPQ